MLLCARHVGMAKRLPRILHRSLDLITVITILYGHLTVCLTGGTVVTVILKWRIRAQIGCLDLVRARTICEQGSSSLLRLILLLSV